MRQALYFFAEGVPAPQGSKRHVGNGRMVESSKKVKPWRAAVNAAALLAFEKTNSSEAFELPVEIWATFYLPRPKTVKRALPSVPPDLDKLERGLFDALTQAGVWADDSLVVRSHGAKFYADTHRPGALVAIEVVSDIPMAIPGLEEQPEIDFLND